MHGTDREMEEGKGSYVNLIGALIRRKDQQHDEIEHFVFIASIAYTVNKREIKITGTSCSFAIHPHLK